MTLRSTPKGLILLCSAGTDWARQFLTHVGDEFAVRRLPDLAQDGQDERAAIPEEVDVVVIGPGVATPLQVGRRLRQAVPFSRILFLLPERELTSFRRMLPFVPELGGAVAASDELNGEELDRVLRANMEESRESRRWGKLNANLNRMLERRPPAPELERPSQTFSDTYLSNVLAQAGDPIFVVAQDGILIAWNTAAARFFGRSMEPGAPISLLQFAVAEQREPLAEALRDAAEGRSIGRYMAVLRNAAGEARQLELNLTQLVEPSQTAPAISCVCRDITEHLQTENRLRDALGEKEVLLREVHHRVKNNLQVILSLLRLRTRSLPEEARNSLLELSARIQAIAQLHNRLSGAEDLSAIDFESFTRELSSDLLHTFALESRITFSFEMEPLNLDFEEATPIALVLVELITNALKHAFPMGRQGTVRISAKQVGDVRVLTVSDDGTGRSDPLPPRADAVGLRILEAMAQQLGGNLTTTFGEGTTATLRIPARPRSI